MNFKYPHPYSEGSLELIAKYYGFLSGYKYAEAYEIVKLYEDHLSFIKKINYFFTIRVETCLFIIKLFKFFISIKDFSFNFFSSNFLISPNYLSTKEWTNNN